MSDVGVSPVESLAEIDVRLRVERIEDLRDLCETSLEQLIRVGTALAVSVGRRAELELDRGFSEEHGTMVLKGGAPATAAFAQASQCVRRCVLLLRQVMGEGWWDDVIQPVMAARDKARAEAKQARDAAAVEADGEAVAAEGVERAERVERVETLGRDFGPGQLVAEIARLREGLRAVSEAAGMDVPELDDDPLSSFAAKPQYPDEDDPAEDGEGPDTALDPPD